MPGRFHIRKLVFSQFALAMMNIMTKANVKRKWLILVKHAELHSPQRDAKVQMILEPGKRHWFRGYGRELLVYFLLFVFWVCLNIKYRTISSRISATIICWGLQYQSIIKKISYRYAAYSLVFCRLFFPNWLSSSQALFHITLTEN